MNTRFENVGKVFRENNTINVVGNIPLRLIIPKNLDAVDAGRSMDVLVQTVKPDPDSPRNTKPDFEKIGNIRLSKSGKMYNLFLFGGESMVCIPREELTNVINKNRGDAPVLAPEEKLPSRNHFGGDEADAYGLGMD